MSVAETCRPSLAQLLTDGKAGRLEPKAISNVKVGVIALGARHIFTDVRDGHVGPEGVDITLHYHLARSGANGVDSLLFAQAASWSRRVELNEMQAMRGA